MARVLSRRDLGRKKREKGAAHRTGNRFLVDAVHENPAWIRDLIALFVYPLQFQSNAQPHIGGYVPFS
jgi:hypothetical protein